MFTSIGLSTLLSSWDANFVLAFYPVNFGVYVENALRDHTNDATKFLNDVYASQENIFSETRGTAVGSLSRSTTQSTTVVKP